MQKVNLVAAGQWSDFRLNVIASLVAAIVFGIAIYIYRKRLWPLWEALRSAWRLHSSLSSINMRAFNRSRADYNYRKNAKTICEYIATAKSSLKIVSFSLITGIQFEEFGSTIQKLVENHPPVEVDISVLDPDDVAVMRAICQAYDMRAEALSESIRTTMERLLVLRSKMKPDAQHKLRLRYHRVIPFASAILIDFDEPHGRIQIETKAYKTGLATSWGFELGAGGKHPFYRTLADAYCKLIEDAEDVQSSADANPPSD